MTTPVWRQYLDIKNKYPDCVLLFRMGDFFETFDDDAKLVARELDIALTARQFGKGQSHPLAGIPYHALESYLGRLIGQGHKVAICEQTSDPASSRAIVDREVVRVVTPGTVTEPSLLAEDANNYLAAVVVEGDAAGVAHIDVSTSSTASLTQLPLEALPLELERLAPAEVIAPRENSELLPGSFSISEVDGGLYHLGTARQALLDHFGVATLEGYGCDGLPLAIRATAIMLDYLQGYQKEAFNRFSGLSTYDTGGTMLLDVQTRRNLELFGGGRWGVADASLLSVLDATRTSMGARLLRRWLGQPLLDLGLIRQRLDSVTWFCENDARRAAVRDLLARVSDMERLVNRARSGNAVPRELVSLGDSLETLPELRATLGEAAHGPLSWLLARLPPCQETASLLRQALEDRPGRVGEGTVIRKGFSPEMDELRGASRDARSYIAGLEKAERERTGIRNIKVGYNKVFGYYIEVTNPNLARVPQDYQRRQTLTSGERFITPELKEYENLVLNARERMQELEEQLYNQVCKQVGDTAEGILKAGDTVAHLDVLAALAEDADRHGYVRPEVNEGLAIEIADGRHPVVERSLPPGSFVPNDTTASAGENQLIILTGPNMAGKSTYIRQVALIVLMAQIGSYVPARSAAIGLVDRIFTRVGLQDDLATGQSTFMVEMVETASILNNATKRSLIVLDEIGRGTSTYDGLSIAQAVAEHIHTDPRLGCRTLFATHYHELTELANHLPRARNYSVAVAENNGEIAFLHRIQPGGADRSYGVHVAQLAGLPRDVVRRAWEVLATLESAGNNTTARPSSPSRGAVSSPSRGPVSSRSRGRRDPPAEQLGLFTEPPPALRELLALDVPSMTPMEAINKLYALQQNVKGEAHADSVRTSR